MFELQVNCTSYDVHSNFGANMLSTSQHCLWWSHTFCHTSPSTAISSFSLEKWKLQMSDPFIFLLVLWYQCTPQLFGMATPIQKNKCMMQKEVWIVWCGGLAHAVSLSPPVCQVMGLVWPRSNHPPPSTLTYVLEDLLIHRPCTHVTCALLLPVL